MKSVALHNLGCKVNAYEIDAMQQMLQEKGYIVVPFDEKADIYIVNTCSVTNIADRKSRQMLHKAKKMNPEAIVVATGCYVQTGQEVLEADPCIDLAVGNNRKKDIVKIIEGYLSEHRVEDAVIDINHTDEYEEMKLTKTADHTRAYIKIQDGCNQFCSYCIIPYARGRVRSRDTANILSEIHGLVEAGYQEVVLTGIHISSYGVDFVRKGTTDYLGTEKSRNEKDIAQQKGYLLNLIREIHKIEGIKRIRIGSLEPRIITDAFARGLGDLPKVCPHFHLSLQSGCDETLRRMNRHYTADEYYEKVELLRKYFEHPAITTDVIVGFPQETDEEFQKTREYLEKVGFYEMHIFKYSKREGTVAAAMEHQVDDTVKTQRSNILLDMERAQSEEFRQYYLGKEVEVLFEEEKEIQGTRYWIGHTGQYVRVAVESRESLANQIKKGRITNFLQQDIMRINKLS
ncbi:MAG: MiaB/RimO family radical SAM methylthiotransferase [Lachnospiraceae bacterium]|nr:MiaB/RimO family radical SAM methylthiotransferase [Lachnospiraceae bacterium]